MSIVLDASMAITWVFVDEQTKTVLDVLRKVTSIGGVVPSLWRLEVANVLRTAVRRGRCDEAYADRALARLSRLSITVDLETDIRAWNDIRRLSREEDLTLYDAAYLELAIRRRSPLASADRRLIDAARRRGLEAVTP